MRVRKVVIHQVRTRLHDQALQVHEPQVPPRLVGSERRKLLHVISGAERIASAGGDHDPHLFGMPGEP